jgi:hypothetical protein
METPPLPEVVVFQGTQELWRGHGASVKQVQTLFLSSPPKSACADKQLSQHLSLLTREKVREQAANNLVLVVEEDGELFVLPEDRDLRCRVPPAARPEVRQAPAMEGPRRASSAHSRGSGSRSTCGSNRASDAFKGCCVPDLPLPGLARQPPAQLRGLLRQFA